MKHCMMLNSTPFELIKSGQKTVEMRLCDKKRSLIKIGDEIEFTNRENGEKLLTCVCNLRKFDSFKELYASYDKSALGYLESETANPQDMSQYYDTEKIKKHGALAIEIKLI